MGGINTLTTRAKRAATPAPRRASPDARAQRCRRKFLRFFPDGFRDATYVDTERAYKWQAHQQWHQQLGRATHRALLARASYAEIAARAVRIESRTNLLFSFEKMALRDAVRGPAGARLFAEGLYEMLWGAGSVQRRFERWREVVGELPRKQTRVRTWPLVTVFGFIAKPDEHMFLKPNVTRVAARKYGFDFHYESVPSWSTYASLLDFARVVQRDVRDLRPRDLIDVQSFVWVQGSDEYAE